MEEVPEKLDTDGTTITVGDPKATVTVHLYEDPRCPFCEQFETGGGAPALENQTVQRAVKTEYTLASFLDGRLGGTGSKKAVNALRAALDEGKFAEYHTVLYQYQPEESVDGFTDAYLLQLASQVKGLRSARFDTAVKSMKYRDFVTASQKAYERAGGKKAPKGPGTPTVVINNFPVPVEHNGILFNQAIFTELLQQIHARPWEWEGTMRSRNDGS
ncbi:DsbA family protein [Streptomyces sp. NPDC001410]|uniref:DsbA family protein n=1 Tax=Streptomyces sp. NPDC001410 TaxID=3364574 RepID=UPI003681DD97